jgi:hypothetical protein
MVATLFRKRPGRLSRDADSNDIKSSKGKGSLMTGERGKVIRAEGRFNVSVWGGD